MNIHTYLALLVAFLIVEYLVLEYDLAIYLLPIAFILPSLFVALTGNEKLNFLNVSILVALKPIVDIFWNNYVFGFKVTHLFASYMIAVSVILFLRFRIRLADFKFWMVPVVWFVFFSFYAFIYFISTKNAIATLEYSLRLNSGIPYFFILGYMLRNETRFHIFLKIFLLFSLIPMIMGMYFLLTRVEEGFQITSGFWRLKGLYHDATAFALEVLSVLMVSLHMYEVEKRKLYILLSALAVYLLFFTYTRSIWTATLLIVLAWVFLYRRVFAMLFLGMFAFLNMETILERWKHAGFTLEETGLSGRIYIWRYMLEQFVQAPPMNKLFGMLMDGYLAGGFAHNQYLQVLYENGLLGFFVFAIVLLLMLRIAISNFRRNFVVLAYLIAFLTIGISASLINVPNVNILLWGMLGVSCYRFFSSNGQR